jgi:dihydroorotate dehydrogenase (NAD+) catalytic subunit
LINLPNSPDLSTNLGSIHLKNPIVTCSGTFASGLEYSKLMDISLPGAITTKSFSIKKIDGNPPPRICETASGMLNSIGLQNEGIDYFINHQLNEVKKLGANIILSIFGNSEEEFIELALKIKPVAASLTAIELNFSCPNINNNGMSFSAIPEIVKKIIKNIKKILDLGIIAKLSPNFDTIIESSYAARDGGADAISLINTITGTSFDIDTFKPRLGNIIGGLSGPAIKPVALLKIYQVAKEKILPIIGMGGIFCWEDAVEFMIAGASAVGIGTANFIDPEICVKILDGINNYMIGKNIGSIKDLAGAAIK